MASSIRKINNVTEVDVLLNNLSVNCTISSFVEVGEDNFCLPEAYVQYEEKIRKFEVRDDDVYVIAHPKTGTTWCQEMLWLIVNNLDYAKAAEKDIRIRAPLLEVLAYLNPAIAEMLFEAEPWQYINNLPSPRVIKSHLHWSLIPEQIRNGTKKPKIISVLRNPYDTFVSYVNHLRVIEGYTGSIEDLGKTWIAGRSVFGPFWKSVLSHWNERHRDNVLILRYKEMKDDLPGVIRKVASFLEKPLSDEQVNKLAHHLSFESMKKNPAVNQEKIINMVAEARGITPTGDEFMKTGTVGGYTKVIPLELQEQFKKWTEESLAGTNLVIE